MTAFLEAVGEGLGTGSVYALLALGFVIIYKAMQVISFAQPAFMLAGIVLVSYLAESVNFWAAVPIAVAAVALLALAVERVAIRPMVGKAVFVIAIITLGVDVVVRVVAGAFIGVDPRSVGDPWGQEVVNVAGIDMAQRNVAALIAMVVVGGLLFAFFRFTPIGLAMRASALDQEAAMAQGVNVGTVFATSWALAGGLAAVAGVFAATGGPIDQNIWIVALAALPVIILGGLDSLGGAVLAGLLIGVVQAVVATYQRDWVPSLETNAGPIVPYLVMMLVLLVRPYGLFGTKEVERV
ncbi:branched-chain amino acid ABC transporter permease [Nocardioides speluncae]|uniref:branched-chain amino acid ABC transporter permease n=1 Tax=Nocardioides speluncae TaxID=2670337 RepID=UPI000D69185E|nr:branched-chain amino acid ABC transporter permease [Nocardioides speluncae]